MAQLFIGTRHALGLGMLAVYERNIMLIPEIELSIRNGDFKREIDSKNYRGDPIDYRYLSLSSNSTQIL